MECFKGNEAKGGQETEGRGDEENQRRRQRIIGEEASLRDGLQQVEGGEDKTTGQATEREEEEGERRGEEKGGGKGGKSSVCLPSLPGMVSVHCIMHEHTCVYIQCYDGKGMLYFYYVHVARTVYAQS